MAFMTALDLNNTRTWVDMTTATRTRQEQVESAFQVASP
jgi:hypothetical protein